MTASDELVRWGLHLLQVPSEEEIASCSADNPSSPSTQSDEALAIRLQEQFYLQDSSNPPIGDFFNSPCPDHSSSEESNHLCDDCFAENLEREPPPPASTSNWDMGNSSSSSRAAEYHHHDEPSANENDEAIAAVLSEELKAQYDGEVGRRLTHMESIPHVPKINGEIPSADAATLDHQRLLERLHVYGLTEHKIPGDGNCQFRALSDQFYRTPDHHMFVRKEVIKQLKLDPNPYEGYVPMKYNDYIKRMSKNGEWGDHVTLQAAADCYGMKICLITSFRDTCIIDIVPKQSKSDRVIFLSFWAEVHYNSVYPEGGIVL